MHIRAQNASLIVRRLSSNDFVQFEVFEVSPQNEAIMSNEGKLLCSYPGPAIQVSTDIFMDECFLRELSSFLVQMDIDGLDSTPTTVKARSVVPEVRETVDPRYISELLMGILGGCGQPADVERITKRIGDEVLWDNTLKPWRRSPFWLTLRVSLQTSLRVGGLYKPFMLFFHAHLLQYCVRRDFPSELLYAMRVKTARRLSKLGSAVSHYDFVRDVFDETEALLSKRWTEFQAKEPTSHPLQPAGLDFIADKGISLKNSYDYLVKVLRLASHGPSQMSFTPSKKPRLDVHDFTQFTNGRLASAFAEDQRVAVADFELTVERDLEFWVVASTNDDNASDVIASCIRQYYDGAKDLYGRNVEDISIMILTIMDLWVALDTLTIRQCPLLKQYSPEIPSDFLHSLLLRRSSTLKRALRIEKYLCRRHKEAYEATSIFSNSVDDYSFSVKYFRASKDLQRLYCEITAFAEQERTSKRAELISLNNEYRSLLNRANNMDHESFTNNFGRVFHPWSCQKCGLERQAKSLNIHVHEWPLSPLTVHAQQTVFELSPPRAFSAWRDMTYLILRDIGLSSVSDSEPVEQPNVQVPLDSFSGLRCWVAAHQKDYRVTICSNTKSFSQAHYKTVMIPAVESSVLVNNGLTFKLFDRIRSSWTKDSFSDSSVWELCTPPIPTSSPYRHLHPFVSGVEHTANYTIASQADSPEEITLHEFLAFSGLRSGQRLQWLNIARELASPFLTFRREEVHTLVTQAAWQLGPLSDGVREWHVDLSLSPFGNALLRELESLLEKVKTNWLEEATVRTIGASCISNPNLVSSFRSSHQQPAFGLHNRAGYCYARS